MTFNLVYFSNAEELHVFKDDYVYKIGLPSSSIDELLSLRFGIYPNNSAISGLCAVIAKLYPQDNLRLTVVNVKLDGTQSGYEQYSLKNPANGTLDQRGAVGKVPPRAKTSPEIEKKFNRAMNAIKRKEEKFLLAGIDLLNSGSPDAGSIINVAGSAGELHEAMQAAYDKFKQTGNRGEFKQAAEKAISIAKNSPLKEHRGSCKEILGYAGLGLLAVLSVATAGLAYLAAGSVNYLINDQFFFSTTINTDSVNRVEDLQEVVDEILAGNISLK